MSGITLHKELGVNPRMVETVCAKCEKSFGENEIVLLGTRNYKFVCNTCGAVTYGSTSCSRNENHDGKKVTLQDYEKIQSGKLDLCETCALEFLVVLSPHKDGYFVVNREAFNVPSNVNVAMADPELWQRLTEVHNG